MAKYRRKNRVLRRRRPRGTRARAVRKMYRAKFRRRVQKIIDRSLKNTPTQVIRNTAAICTINDLSPTVKTWFTFTPGIDVFKRNMGSSVNINYPFEGQSIKIKKWWIKGTIQYDAAGLVSTTLSQSEVGYVDLYLMRTRLEFGTPNTRLPDMYQSGVEALPCDGARRETLLPINKNSYRIYAHKRFKMGASWVRQDSVPVVSVNEQNNDFSYARNFSFDVTKYIGKNHIVRYKENEEPAQDNLLSTLTLVAVWHPACGDLGTPALGVGLDHKTAYIMDCCSWGEYETA
jgi:hypothetical protein